MHIFETLGKHLWKMFLGRYWERVHSGNFCGMMFLKYGAYIT